MTNDSPATPSVDAPSIEDAYDRTVLRPSIVHIGVGGFHRAHLATYVDDLCRAGSLDWSIVGAGVLPGDAAMAEALDAQHGMYTLIVRGQDTTTVQVIGSIVDYVHAWPDPDELIDRIAAPTTQIVSLTVTEGGYPVDDADGSFVADSPNAAHGSAFAILAAGLERRRTASGSPITIMSCDNVIGNGHVTAAAVLGCAEAHGADLVSWIGDNVTFPNSMVDRITPASAPSDAAWLLEEHHIDDRWPVVTEPFRQWVVEDRFAGDRLPLEMIDVIVTDNVEPYELMKLRLLNAGHSCIAYLAALLDVETVSDAMAQPEIAAFLTRFLEAEARPVLPAIVGIDIDEYITTLVHRFSNPNIGDQIARLCLDGSAKFPKFLVPTILRQLDAGGPVDLSALAIAGWCEYLNGTTESGATIDLARDPHLDRAVAAAAASKTDPVAFLTFDAVFADLPPSSRFHEAFAGAIQGLRSDGARSTIERLLAR